MRKNDLVRLQRRVLVPLLGRFFFHRDLNVSRFNPSCLRSPTSKPFQIFSRGTFVWWRVGLQAILPRHRGSASHVLHQLVWSVPSDSFVFISHLSCPRSSERCPTTHWIPCQFTFDDLVPSLSSLTRTPSTKNLSLQAHHSLQNLQVRCRIRQLWICAFDTRSCPTILDPVMLEPLACSTFDLFVVTVCLYASTALGSSTTPRTTRISSLPTSFLNGLQ